MSRELAAIHDAIIAELTAIYGFDSDPLCQYLAAEVRAILPGPIELISCEGRISTEGRRRMAKAMHEAASALQRIAVTLLERP